MFLVIYKANVYVSVLYPNWLHHHLHPIENLCLALRNPNVIRNELIDALL